MTRVQWLESPLPSHPPLCLLPQDESWLWVEAKHSAGSLPSLVKKRQADLWRYWWQQLRLKAQSNFKSPHLPWRLVTSHIILGEREVNTFPNLLILFQGGEADGIGRIIHRLLTNISMELSSSFSCRAVHIKLWQRHNNNEIHSNNFHETHFSWFLSWNLISGAL